MATLCALGFGCDIPGDCKTDAQTKENKLQQAAPNAELIWASPRELLNVFQADAIGCHIITVTNDILQKLSLVGRDLGDYSLDTVKMFHNDGMVAGFAL